MWRGVVNSRGVWDGVAAKIDCYFYTSHPYNLLRFESSSIIWSLWGSSHVPFLTDMANPLGTFCKRDSDLSGNTAEMLHISINHSVGRIARGPSKWHQSPTPTAMMHNIWTDRLWKLGRQAL